MKVCVIMGILLGCGVPDAEMVGGCLQSSCLRILLNIIIVFAVSASPSKEDLS